MAPPKQKVIHDPVLINLAIKEVAANKGKLREVARKYGIPKSTLHFKFKNPGHKTSFGPSPVLTTEEEETLENWIILLAKKGFLLKKEDLQSSVQKFLRDNPRTNSFKDNYPGAGWIRGFLKRHPVIAARTSEGVTQSSACVSESDIRKWFSEIHRYLEENNLLEVLNDPRRVFNGDESGFQLCPKTGKVLAAKGSRNVYTIDSNNSKESITVMFTFAADGQTSPPMVVYNYQRIPQKVAESVPDGWGVGRSESGWMTSELFFEYIANVFHPYLLKKEVTMPVLYFLDGHKTHLTYEVSKLCKALNIELIALYPNATRILQPADVGVFKPVKAAWKEASRRWLMENPNEIITKVNFAKVLKVALDTAVKPNTLVNGFKACGLFPFNPDAVDYSKCLGTNKQCEQVNVEPLASENFITVSKFVDLMGPTKIKELRTCENVTERDENFQLLHKLYNVLRPLQRPPFPETLEYLPVPSLQHTDVSSIEESSAVTTNIANTSCFPDIELPTTDPNANVSFITTISEMNLNEQTPSKDPAPQIGNVDLENSPAFKIMSDSRIGTYLTLPKTPERKGKRNVVRMPFAVTSDNYRNMFKEQKFRKDTELQKKEERKRLREETKLKKVNDKINKKNKIKHNVATTNACSVCSKATKSNNRVTCDMCSLLFHTKCVPKRHQEHVPEDIDIDLFICHKCYAEDNGDQTLDYEVLDEEALEEDVDFEANLIFDLYTKEKNN